MLSQREIVDLCASLRFHDLFHADCEEAMSHCAYSDHSLWLQDSGEVLPSSSI